MRDAQRDSITTDFCQAITAGATQLPAPRSGRSAGGHIARVSCIQLALGAAAGVSDNSSLTIAQLLLPDSANKWRRLAIAEPKRAKDGKLNKVDCFRVEGKYGDNPITLWIDM